MIMRVQGYVLRNYLFFLNDDFQPVCGFTLYLYFRLGYAAVDIEYGTYGRVNITHDYGFGIRTYELCSYGYHSRTGEFLCRSKGSSYNTYTT